MPISLLRIAGLVLAVILLWLAIRRLRGRGSGSRVPGRISPDRIARRSAA